MIGAILGDTIGSVFENIPQLQSSRKISTPTDDSFLTCACQDWLNNINPNYYNEILTNSIIQNELFESTIFYLKKWGNLFPTSGFSKSFIKWVNTEPSIQIEKNTNGCLMRQSPIASFCFKNNLSIETAIKLSEIFASPTHNHHTVYPIIKSHISFIYNSLHKKINETNFKLFLKEENIGLLPPSEWAKTGAFIWDAPRSLAIAYSSLFYADNFDSTMQNCIDCVGDTDTYCAIAGPIAQAIWGIPQNTINKNIEFIQEFKEITNLFPELK